LGLLLALAVGCQPAARYVIDKEKSADEGGAEQPAAVPEDFAWRPAPPPYDVPLHFVASTNPEWTQLGSFWNPQPKPTAGVRAAGLGLTPLGAVTVAGLTLEPEVVKIKVPLGLPDPTPHIPPSNPPTLAKWHLGKKLFYTDDLLPTGVKLGQSCVKCHIPAEGYTNRKFWKPGTSGLEVNTLSLLNVAYNQRLFWDGRVGPLENMIQRGPADEGRSHTEVPRWEYHHVWGGVVKRLNGRKEYVAEFERVFGTGPSVDGVGKALATYLRTLLVGDSLYDQAEQTRQERKAAELTAEHFAPHLKSAGALRRLEREGKDEKDVAKELERGHRVFVKSRCNQCHSGPLFTDQDYHNIGVDMEALLPGRELTAPYGLKAFRYKHAFRTPTLRNLPRTKPYMHTGKMETLREVLHYYNDEIGGAVTQYLDPLLRDANKNIRALKLSAEELDALELFLRALDGGEVPAWVADEPKK
jgi:cytochrome c peroxidase